jgi:hypothetical protein
MVAHIFNLQVPFYDRNRRRSGESEFRDSIGPNCQEYEAMTAIFGGHDTGRTQILGPFRGSERRGQYSIRIND